MTLPNPVFLYLLYLNKNMELILDIVLENGEPECLISGEATGAQTRAPSRTLTCRTSIGDPSKLLDT